MLNPLLPIPLLFIFFFLVKWIYSTTKTIHKNLPPSPPKFPVLGNLHQLGSRPHRSLQQLAHCYGKLLLLHLGIRPVLVVSSSSAAREIMKTNDTTFSNRPKLAFADRLLYEGKDVSAAPHGEYWRRMRSIYVLQLLSHKRVLSFRAVREEELELLVEHVKQSSLLSLPVNLSEMFASLTSDVVCRVAFGRKYSGGR